MRTGLIDREPQKPSTTRYATKKTHEQQVLGLAGAIGNLESALSYCTSGNAKQAGDQALYAIAKLTSDQFTPSNRCRCWGVVVVSTTETHMIRNLTHHQARVRMTGILNGMVEDHNKMGITGVHLVCERESVTRRG